MLNWYIDQYTWWFLQLYFLPYRMPELHSDVDRMVSSISTNGARWANLCKPN